MTSNRLRFAVVMGGCFLLCLGGMAHSGYRFSDEMAEGFLARKERWAIKTGADPAAPRLKAEPQQITVAELALKKRPPELPANATSRAARFTRFSAAENTLYTIDADILRYKLEKDDHDIHVVIRQHSDTSTEPVTMVVEIPHPDVVVMKSPWRKRIGMVREEFDRHFKPTGRFTRRIIHAKITGVGFFDFLHGQSGMAPNGLELHPVLKIEYPDSKEGKSAETETFKERTETPPHIEDATKGQVWVNLISGKYWYPGTRYYGKTAKGKYMTEKDAKAAGYVAAKGQN